MKYFDPNVSGRNGRRRTNDPNFGAQALYLGFQLFKIVFILFNNNQKLAKLGLRKLSRIKFAGIKLVKVEIAFKLFARFGASEKIMVVIFGHRIKSMKIQPPADKCMQQFFRRSFTQVLCKKMFLFC